MLRTTRTRTWRARLRGRSYAAATVAAGSGRPSRGGAPRPRGRLEPEDPASVRVVEQVRTLALVVGLLQLTDHRLEQAQPPQDHAGHVRHLHGRYPGGRGELLDGLALRAGRVARHVPGPSPAVGVGSGGDDRARHVDRRRPRVRLVEITDGLDRLAGEDPRHDAVAEHALGAGADVVRAADLGRADPARVMGGLGVVPHAHAHPGLLTRGGQREVLGHRHIDRPIPVQVRHGREHGTRALGVRQERVRDRRPVGDPPVIGRVDAVVDHDGRGCRTEKGLEARRVELRPARSGRRPGRARCDWPGPPRRRRRRGCGRPRTRPRPPRRRGGYRRQERRAGLTWRLLRDGCSDL